MVEVKGTPAAVYCRISRDKVGAGLGVERQESECRELADRLGWEVVDVLVDNDVSASSGRRRDGYERLLEGVRAGRYRGIIAWHTDRLHRRPVELERFIDITGGAGVVTHTVRAGELDLSTSSGRMVARMLGAAARAESERLAERVASSRAQSRTAGKYGGGPRPFGFEDDGVSVRPDEAAEIVKATEALLAGGSVRGVVLDLNRRGVVTSTGAAWSSRTLRSVLRRARNAGLIEHAGEVIGPATWPALVTEDQWRRLVQLLDDPTRRTSPGNQVRHLLSNMAVCGVCGGTRITCAAPGGTKPGKKRRAPAYRCQGGESIPGGTRHITRDQASTDLVVTETILARLEREDARELLKAGDDGPDTAAIASELGALRERRASMLELAADGTLTQLELRGALRKMAERATELEAQLAAAPSSSPVASLVAAEDVRAAWEALDLGRQRAVIDALAVVTLLPSKGSGRFDPDSVEITWRS